MKNITEIINDYITENRISKAALARSIGSHKQTLNGRLKNRDMTISFVQQLSKSLGHNFFTYLVEQPGNEKEMDALKFEVELLRREKETLSGIIERIMTKVNP